MNKYYHLTQDRTNLQERMITVVWNLITATTVVAFVMALYVMMTLMDIPK